MSERALTKKQLAFVNAYLKTGSGSAAYRAAYDCKRMTDKSVAENASKLLRHTKIAPIIESARQKAAQKLELTAERVLQEVARLAFADPRRLYDEKGNLKPIHELSDNEAALIASVEVEEEFEGRGEEKRLAGYVRKVKLWDKNSALEKAMKHLRLFEDGGQGAATVIYMDYRSAPAAYIPPSQGGAIEQAAALPDPNRMPVEVPAERAAAEDEELAR